MFKVGDEVKCIDTEGTEIIRLGEVCTVTRRNEEQLWFEESHLDGSWSIEKFMLCTTEGRHFETGAYRDTAEGKLNYRGFFSHTVMKRHAQYMHKHRKQSNGEMRDADNWKQGIPKEVYMESMWRHFFDVWESYETGEGDLQELLCALRFNVDGMLHEELRKDES